MYIAVWSCSCDFSGDGAFWVAAGREPSVEAPLALPSGIMEALLGRVGVAAVG